MCKVDALLFDSDSEPKGDARNWTQDRVKNAISSLLVAPTRHSEKVWIRMKDKHKILSFEAGNLVGDATKGDCKKKCTSDAGVLTEEFLGLGA